MSMGSDSARLAGDDLYDDDAVAVVELMPEQQGAAVGSGALFGSRRINTVYLGLCLVMHASEESQPEPTYWFLILFVDRAGKCLV